jgi:hypothetical protein
MRISLPGIILLLVICLAGISQEARAQYAIGYSEIAVDQGGRQILAYSTTFLDYYAGLYYDPETEADLYWQFDDEIALDGGHAIGYEDLIEAAVFNSTSAYIPLVWYEEFSGHFIRPYYGTESLSLYWDPWGYSLLPIGGYEGYFDIFGFWSPNTYIPTRRQRFGTIDLYIQTPPDPIPPPPPAPSASVNELGFTGDFPISTFVDGVSSTERTIDSSNDGVEPVWKSADSSWRYPVAYVKGARPTMAANIAFSPALTSSQSAKIRAKKGGAVIATKDVTFPAGGGYRVTGITSQADLETTPDVRKSTYTFDWEVSWDNGSSWSSMGSSGPVTFYWTYDTPKPNPFNSLGNVPFPKLYDKALDIACTYANSAYATGLSVPENLAASLTGHISDHLYYSPGGPIEGVFAHPLRAYIRTDPKGQCSDHALLLEGLLKSIGVAAVNTYVWGGDAATMDKWHYWFITGAYPDSHIAIEPTLRATRSTQNGDAEPFPHFTFHDVVKLDGSSRYFDPSYGDYNTQVEMDETFHWNNKVFNEGASASSLRVYSQLFDAGAHKKRGGDGSPPAETDICPHTTATGLDEAVFVTQSAPDVMTRGQTYNVSVTMRNTGIRTWTADIYKLGSQSPQDNFSWGTNRILLTSPVPPSGEVTFNFTVTPQAGTPATLNFQWRMVKEGVYWFGQPTLLKTVTIN